MIFWRIMTMGIQKMSKVDIINSLSLFLCLFFILNQVKIVQTAISNSQPIATYQPPYLEAQPFQYQYVAGGSMTPPNLATGVIYRGDINITFERIHLIQPFNFQVTVSLTGLEYALQWKNVSSTSMVSVKVISTFSTSFVVESYMQNQTNFVYMKCRYLAYNSNYLTDFYFDSGLSIIPNSLDFTVSRTETWYFAYSTPSTPTDYKFFYVMEGIDLVMVSSYFYIIWKANLDIYNSTHYKLDLVGEKCFLNKVLFSVLFYESKMEFNSTLTFCHIKFERITQFECSGNNTVCIVYNPLTSLSQIDVYDDNFFIGNHAVAPTWTIFYDIRLSTGVIESDVTSWNYIHIDGFVFYGYICPNGQYFDEALEGCAFCPEKCLQCTELLCSSCDTDYVFSIDGKSCVSIYTPSPSFLRNCLYFNNTANFFTCIICNVTRGLEVDQATSQCICKVGFSFNTTSEMCEDICGDGHQYTSECDDGNTLNGDGCDAECNLEVGFFCSTNVTPTVCNSALQLKYKIDMILKIEDEEAAGLVILSPTITNLPFSVLKENFNSTNYLDFKLILKDKPVEETYELNFELQKVENNKIYLYFQYNFTVERLNASIYLNYGQTRYLPSNQTLDFQLIGLNAKLEFTSYYKAYSTVSQGILIATLFGLIGLASGLFLPKFIGIETIVTLQLIFYSQILIYEPDNWPVGFTYLKYLKISTGYNDFISLTNYLQLTNITKKFTIINLKKTIIENFNINFLIVIVFAIGFYCAALIRSKKETEIETYIKVNKIKEPNKNHEVKIMMKKFKIPLKINELSYWIISQLCIWSILPIMSSVGAEFLIPNSMITFVGEKYQLFFLSVRGVEFFIILFVVLSIVLNHFKNAFLSRKILKKIQERPEELFYKQLLYIYLFVMGGLIFFFNDIKLSVIPISVIILFFHTIYALSLFFIQPYKQSLRIHAFTLYMNQVLYGVFLIVVNLINMLNNLDEALILYIGYAITGWVGFLILMTFVRLYYEIRYGEALEKEIQAEREKEAEEEKIKEKLRLNNKIDQFQKEAKEKLTKLQEQRDMNSYLLETQQKEFEKKNLLEWLEGKNWEEKDKERYYFKKFHEKPLEWLKENRNDEYQKKVEQLEERNLQIEEKKKNQKENIDYIEVTAMLRDNLETKKKLLRTFKKDSRKKKEENKWNHEKE